MKNILLLRCVEDPKDRIQLHYYDELQSDGIVCGICWPEGSVSLDLEAAIAMRDALETVIKANER